MKPFDQFPKSEKKHIQFVLTDIDDTLTIDGRLPAIALNALERLAAAGGINILLYSSINQFQWQSVALILIAVFGIVVISEFVSAAVRKKIS